MPAPTSQARPGPPPVTYEKRWSNIFDIASNQVLAQKWHKCALFLKGGEARRLIRGEGVSWIG